jgi:hypothetical protein
MPQIIVRAHTANGESGTVTLAERAVPTDQQSDHYSTQLIERIGWALIVAERLESQKNGSQPHGPNRSVGR